MKKIFKYSDGIECILSDEGVYSRLLLKREHYKVEIIHPDFGFLYEMKDYYVDYFRKMIEKQEIFKIKKMYFD